MQVCPGNEFGLATPLQLRQALREVYYVSWHWSLHLYENEDNINLS